MSVLRVGLVGYGSMGRNHARVIRGLSSATLVGVADSNRELGSFVDGTPRFDSVDELISHGLDACVVAAPTSLHRAIGESLANAKVPTLLEKPLAGSPEDAQALVEAFATSGTIGAVGHIERFNPAIQELKKRLDEGQLGDVYQIVTQRQGPYPGRIGDVGVISDLASHDVDLTRFVSSSSYDFVMASTAHKSGRTHEDLVSITGKLKNGIVINHIVNWLSPLKQRQTIVTGERGAFVASTLTGDLTFFENGQNLNDWEAVASFRGVAEGNVIGYSFVKHEPLKNELETFINSILTQNLNSIVTLETGLAVVKTCDAVAISALEKRVVSL